MSEKKQPHTPGPWRWFDYPDGRKLLAAPARAVIHCPDAPMQVDPPDAQLIVAAPELKDGCNALIGLIQLVCQRDDMPPDIKRALLFSHRMDEALAAIAKSEGKS